MTTRSRALGLALAAATTVVLWQFTAGRYLLYPFTILATWFHEMGHGLCAMLLGGSFVSLSLFPDGSGYAVHSGSRFLGQPGLALIAAAGPLGPALAGAMLIFFSLRPKWSRLALTGVALVLLLIRFKGTDRWHSLTLQFIGVQACISVFLNIDYLFTEKVRVSGRLVHSDTGQIAAALFLPYWFWAILLTGLTLWLPAWSLARALRATGRSS
jgi:hypothetical protein